MKIKILIFTLITCLFLTACSASKSTSAGSYENKSTSTIQSEFSSAPESEVKSNDEQMAESEIESYEITPFSSTYAGVPYGLSPDELAAALSENEIEVVTNNVYFPEGGVKDGRTYDAHTGGFLYYVADKITTDNSDTLYFYRYNRKAELIELLAISPNFSTNEGLKIGDSLDKMIRIYGEAYRSNVDNVNVDTDTGLYSYFNGSEFLFIKIYDDVVSSFVISQSSTLIGIGGPL